MSEEKKVTTLSPEEEKRIIQEKLQKEKGASKDPQPKK